jgi:hypothetical protein
MTKKKELTVKIEMNIRSAAAVRQILFEHQKDYSYQFPSERINEIREVIYDLDDKIACAIDPE